jgi:hypothetical protein
VAVSTSWRRFRISGSGGGITPRSTAMSICSLILVFSCNVEAVFRRIAIAFAVTAVLAIGLALLWPTNSDCPVYKGHRLTYWLDIKYRADETPERASEATEAILKIGTNALPWLVDQIRSTPPPGAIRTRSQLTYIILRAVLSMTPSHARAVRARLAVVGFMTLGTNAAPAIPALRTIIDRTNSPSAADRALLACCYIGKDAFPTFAQIMTNTHHPKRLLALTLAPKVDLGTNSSALLPVLETCTADPDPEIAATATGFLNVRTNTIRPNHSTVITIPVR